jgi:hypothetical protein
VARIALVFVLAGMAIAASPAQARLTCHSHARFRDGSVKVLTRYGKADDQQWFLCTARFRRPKLFLDEGASTVDLEPHFRRFGNRIGYAWLWSSNPNGGWEMGWVDVRTAFSPAVSVSFNNVKDSLGIKGFAVGARGDMAYLEGVGSNARHPRGAERIGYVPVRGKGLGNPRTLVRFPAPQIRPGSLALSPTRVTWTEKSGAPGSTQLPGAP